MISDDDVRKIAVAGGISEAQLPRLKGILNLWKAQNESLLEDKKLDLGHKEQLKIAKQMLACLQKFNTLCKLFPQSYNLLVTMDTQRASECLSDPHLSRALVRIPRQKRRSLARIRREEDILNTGVRQLEKGPLLPFTPNAAKDVSAHLALCILLYFGSHNRLSEKSPTSDNDPIVKFARAVFELIEGEHLNLSASRHSFKLASSTVRSRLAAQFERAKVLSSPRKPNLRSIRKKREAWIQEAIEAAGKVVPPLSPEDAKALVNGLELDLDVDPAEAVRAAVAAWND